MRHRIRAHDSSPREPAHGKRQGPGVRVTLGKLAAGATGLIAVGYLVLVAINWSDRAPSATTITFSDLYDNRPNPDDTDNAYTYMLAFSSPPNADPYELGSRRQAWIQTAFASPEDDAGADPLDEPYDYRSERSEDVENLAGACNAFRAECIEALVGSESVVSQWLESEEWLLDRYNDMIALTGYRETPFDHSLPLPPYSDISDIRKLLFIRAWAGGKVRNAGSVESLLHQDLVFWRMVLANSDTLITKLIASSAVANHFKMANLIVRDLQRGGLNIGMPASWLVEISDAERSMQRSLIGEWVLLDRTFKRTFDDVQEADLAVWGHAFWMAIAPFLQPQDLSNRYADGVMRYISVFSEPYDSIPDALSQIQQMPRPLSRPFSRAYNLAGDYLYASGPPDFSDYGLRVADLEGIRRAAVAAWRLRAEGVALEDMESRLRMREWSDPYTNAALEWVAATNEIVFQRQSTKPSSNRGRHAFSY
jgi:hypothetical protein